MDQQIILQAQMLQQQSQELEQNLKFIEEQIADLGNFSESLTSLEKTSEKEILTSLGRGVHLKTSLESKDLYVEVGSGVVVKKTPSQALETIKDQISQLTEARTNVMAQIETTNHELSTLVSELEKARLEAENQN